MRRLFFTLICASLFISCSSPEEAEVLEDTKAYLVFEEDGALFEIGNKTGNISPAGAISGLDPKGSVIFNAIVTTPEKIYVYEQWYTPSIEGYLHIYDRSTGLTQNKKLSFSEQAYGDNPVLVSLDWDYMNNSLVGIVTSKAGYPEGNSFVVEIDPESLEIHDLGIALGQSSVISTTVRDTKLFASLVENQELLLEIDLEQKSFRSLELPHKNVLTQLSSNDRNDNLFGFVKGSTGSNNGGPSMGNRSEPFILKVSSYDYLKVLPGTETGSMNFNAKSIYDSVDNVHVSFMHTSEFAGIMEYNILTKETTYIKDELWKNQLNGRSCILTAIPK